MATLSYSPILTEQLFLVCDVALIAGGQVLHGQLGFLLVGFANGCLIWLKLDDIYNFVQCG